MKWVMLAIILVAAAVLSAALRGNRNYLPYAAFFLGLIPFVEGYWHLTSDPISWAVWQGQAKGLQFGFTDALAIAILMSSQKTKSPISLKIALAIILVAFGISTFSAPQPTAAFFVGWEIVRNVIVFLAVLRGSLTNEKFSLGLMYGLIAGLCVQACVVVTQYAGGVARAGGWFGHPNLLGFSAHFVVYPAFAAFLGGYYRKTMLLAVGAGLVIAFAGASRAMIGLLPLGLFLTAVFSSWHNTSGRKTAIIFAAVVGCAVLSPILYSALNRRSAEDQVASSAMRDAMNEAATMILTDHPFGVGANQYVFVANLGGYSERAGVPWNFENRSAPVHNSYRLIAAEMGWLGLIGLLAMFGSAFAIARSAFRRAPPSFGGELAAGVTATIVVAAIHAYYEWVFTQHVVQILLAMSIGLAAAANATVRNARSRPRSIAVPLNSPHSSPAY